MEVAYYFGFVIMIVLYVIYYNKLNLKIEKIIAEENPKKFDTYASIHSFLFMIYTVLILLFNAVFLCLFMNKYGGSWVYIAPLGILCIILLFVVTITGFKKKKIILDEYKKKYGMELHFYDLIRFISLYRHTLIFAITALLINLISMFFQK